MEVKKEKWDQIKGLFQAALEVDPGSRRRFLQEQSSSIELCDAVQELLLAHEEAGSFLHEKAALAEFSQSDAGLNRLAPGNLLADRFRIVRFIAKGGMGEVYEAEDLELHARVALKTIRHEIADYPAALTRFKREVHLAQQVTHPNVCRIFDLFQHLDPVGGVTVFLTMERLTGKTLAEHLRQRGPMDTDEAVAILRQIALALEAAHSAGILHRDLKPGNIILEPGRDGKVRAVITDFGMAWSQDPQGGQALTISGQAAFGTLEYMSPEQIEGKPLTSASDIYSLGLVTYQMITGAKAFEAETPLISALRRLTERAPLPSLLLPDIDDQWNDLIAHCLERDPARRLSSTAEFAAALPANAPGLAPRRRRAIRALAALQNWIGSHRITTAALTIGCMVLAGILVGFSRMRQNGPKSGNPTLVLADFVNTTGEPVFDNTLNLALAAKLQQSPFLSLMPEAKVRLELRYMGLPARTRLTETVAREVCLRGNGQVLLQGSIATNEKGYIVSLRAVGCQSGKVIADEKSPVEFRASVLDVLDQAADALRPRLGESLESIHKYNVPLGEATTNSLEALSAYSEGTWNQQGGAAAEHFLRATELDPNFALAYARLGTIYGNMGDTQRSEDALRKAFDRRDRVTEWERFYIVSHYYGFVTGELDKEQRTYEEWAKIYPHDMAWTMNLSVDYAFVGQFNKAIELQKRAIQEIPGNSASYVNIAQYYLAIDHPDEAQSVLDQAQQLHLQDLNLQIDEYQVDYYRNDTAAMSKLLASASTDPGAEDALLAQQSATEDSEGRPALARDLAASAAAVAVRAGNREVSANWLAGEAVRQAELGLVGDAGHLLTQALAVPNAAQGRDVQLLVALASAESRDFKRATSQLAALMQGHPLDTLIQSYWAPVIRARLAYSQGKYAQAVQTLAGTEAYDLGAFTPGQCMDAAYLRGEALLAEHQGSAAAAEFRKVLAHRGLVLNCPTGALSQLGLARSLARSGDIVGSRASYQDLFVLWKRADKDFSLLRQAENEYRALR